MTLRQKLVRLQALTAKLGATLGLSKSAVADATQGWDETARLGLSQLYLHPAAAPLLSRFSKGATLFAIDDSGVVVAALSNRPMPITSRFLASVVSLLSPQQLQNVLAILLTDMSKVFDVSAPEPSEPGQHGGRAH